MVRLRFGPLVLSLGMSRLKKTGLMVRMPMGETCPAIEAEPDAWAVIEHAAISAVAADPVSREHILGPEIFVIERSQAKISA